MGGKPSKQTPADQRLKENKGKPKKVTLPKNASDDNKDFKSKEDKRKYEAYKHIHVCPKSQGPVIRKG